MELLESLGASGRTQDPLFDYIIDGMNYTPSRPAYEDMRDGILAAIDAATHRTSQGSCLVWKAFAQFGIGQGANGAESCNFIRCTGTVSESFVVPAGVCSAPTNTAPTVSISLPANNSSFVKATPITFTLR